MGLVRSLVRAEMVAVWCLLGVIGAGAYLLDTLITQWLEWLSPIINILG